MILLTLLFAETMTVCAQSESAVVQSERAVAQSESAVAQSESAVAQSGSAAEPSEILTVGVPTDRCPIFYRDPENGEISGIGVDLMVTAAEKAGYRAEFREITEKSLKAALDNESYDVVMPFGSALTSESGKPSIVTDNLMQTPFTLVTKGRQDMPPLNKLHVGMLKSLAAGAETVNKLYPGIEITLYGTMDECVRALRDGKVDALLHNSYVWSYVLQKPSYSDLMVQPSAMFSMDFRIGTTNTPTGREKVARLNRGIALLEYNRRQAVILDYTSRRLYRYDLGDYLYQYGLILFLCALILVFMVVIALQRQSALKREQEEKMRKMVDYDQLTGVLSLTGFRKKAEELIRRHPDIAYMISYNNIKDFKYINESFGKMTGDELLRFWADRSMERLSEEEAIGRLEGDHFAVLRRVNGMENMRGDEKDVFELVRDFFIAKGKDNKVLICSGIYVLTPEDYYHIDVDQMLDYARVAERKVRDSGKGGYAFYNQDQWERGKRMADIVGHLTAAIRDGEIRVWYQPQVNYKEKKITGAEALCRWEHNKLGWLSPGEFIPILEESGGVYELNSFVWETVCQDLARWNEEGKHFSVSVNMSRSDIQSNPGLPEFFANLTRTYRLSPDQLRIEITETAYVEDPAILIEMTKKLRSYGFKVEMDDFGSGYSSLHMLKEVPVDRIKLDLMFLSGRGDPKKGRVIVSHMIRMIRSLGMDMIAEGVETVEQADFLCERGCPEMQGYYYAKPMPADAFEKMLNGETECFGLSQ